MSGIFELHNITEGTVTRWKTAEQLRHELNQIADDFDDQCTATKRQFELIEAAIGGNAWELKKAQITVEADRHAEEIVGKVLGRNPEPVVKTPIAEMAALAKREGDRLWHAHRLAAYRVVKNELAAALVKIAAERKAREEQHAAEVRKSRSFEGGWYSQPAYASDIAAKPLTVEKVAVSAVEMHPELRRRLH
jgi:hypothetical protein